MGIKAGTKLGPYEIVAPLGAGGMGEVYRARDTRIGREVALKILPSNYSENPDRLLRFEQEARTAGLLNHPNLLAIYDVGNENGSPYIVSELLEGETLREKLQAGPLSARRVIEYGTQLAGGLAAAHDKGIIHRDLKPDNLFLTKDGRLKILDFGLAKLHLPEPEILEGHSQLRTVASQSTPGMILGTVGYMSPEQVRGLAADQRTDIFAFGAVLYEMQTGKRAFAGNTPADTISAILQKDPPDLSESASGASPGLDRILRHCMEKEPDQRFQSARDVAFALEALSGTSDTKQISEALAPVKKNREWIWKIAAAICFLAALGAISALLVSPKSSTTKLEPVYLDITYPSGVEPYAALSGGFVVSPDGQSIAMIGIRDGARRLYIRRLDHSEPTEITNTSGINSVCFSPDGISVAYVPGDSVLTTFSLTDQQRKVLVEGVDIGGITWAGSGVVYNRSGALWIVPSNGGTPRQLTTLDASREEVMHADPLVLPGERTILFSSLTPENGTERIEAVSVENGKRSVVLERAITPIWSPTGHLLFGRDGAILAVPFDPDSVQVRGTAVQVIPAGVIGTLRNGTMGFSVSNNGTLVFIPFNFASKHVISVGRDGSEVSLSLPANGYFNPRISPDGRKLLVEYQLSTVDLIDLQRGTRAKLLPSAFGTSFPTWTSNSEGAVFRRFNVPFWAAADGSGKTSQIPSGMLSDFPSSPGPDSDSYILLRILPKTSGDIYLMSISGKFPPKPLITTSAYDGGPQLSPDGKWLLYQSNESGQAEIYVRQYPALDRQWQVSESGGMQPRWNSTTSEIYYRNGKNMMAVAFDSSGKEPTFGKPNKLFADQYDFGQGLSIANYDVTRDGRFIMLRRGTEGSTFRVVLNWTEELKKKLAASSAQ
jgi:eukaryotic-like serine/threonine-protein kinase